ncbi:four helix bundle protein [bacterium]|nr:four helix bundle protein [bacterium]
MKDGLSVAEPTTRGKIRHFTDLIVWQEAHPLVQQLIRAAFSIPANIAEGFRRRTKPDPILQYCSSFAGRANLFFILAKDLGYVENDCREQIDHLDAKLTRLSQSIQA